MMVIIATALRSFISVIVSLVTMLVPSLMHDYTRLMLLSILAGDNYDTKPRGHE